MGHHDENMPAPERTRISGSEHITAKGNGRAFMEVLPRLGHGLGVLGGDTAASKREEMVNLDFE